MSMSLGERLTTLREEKGLTLEAAATATKIQIRTLEAIEKNQVQEILDPAYGKIFLKRYADFLGIDGEALMREYGARFGSEQIPSLTVSAQLPSLSKTGPQVILSAALGFIAVIGIVFIGNLLLSRAGQIDLSSEVTTAPSVGVSSAKPSFLVRPGKALNLTVEVREDVWMQIKSDGEVIFQNVLKKGSRERWKAKKDLEIWTGNAAAMDMSLNGQGLGTPGRGVIKGIRVTHAGVTLPE